MFAWSVDMAQMVVFYAYKKARAVIPKLHLKTNWTILRGLYSNKKFKFKNYLT